MNEKPVTVKAPVPGHVVRALAAAGDAVVAGQPVVVVEVMLMETTICAPATGLVQQVMVATGQGVAQEQPLIRVA